MRETLADFAPVIVGILIGWAALTLLGLTFVGLMWLVEMVGR